MKNICWFLCLLVAALCSAQDTEPVTKDVEGHDHPLLKRYEGSFIIGFTEKGYAEYKLILGKALNPTHEESGGKRVEKEQTVEGRVTRITYLAPLGRSPLEVWKNYDNELKAKGAETLVSAANPEGLGYDFGALPQYDEIDRQLFSYSHTNARYGAYKLPNAYVAIYAAQFEDGYTIHPVQKGQTAVQVDIVETKAMEEKMAVPAATPVADTSAKQARVTQIIREVNVLLPDASPRPAASNETVREGSAVKTGNESRTELTFVDLTITRLGANTLFNFKQAGRELDLTSGSILLRVPKNSGGATIKTAAVTAGITGTTLIFEYSPPGRSKMTVLEGSASVTLVKYPSETRMVRAGQMVDIPAGATTIPEPVDIDLDGLMKTSPLTTDFAPLPSQDLIMAAIQEQKAGTNAHAPAATPAPSVSPASSSGMQVTESDSELKINLVGDILFDFDKTDIRPQAEPTLTQLLTLLQKYPKANVLIEGHTDGKGAQSYNQKLSERRAAAVKAWLVAHGFPEPNVWTRGIGAEKPIAPNARPNGADDPEGRQKNRRVEITVKK